jgi:nucleotide-binding universal stress UspA family protein
MERILLAYDGSEPARRALDTAADLAAHYGASLSVLSVVPVHPGRTPIDPWDDRDVHRLELHDAATRLRERGIEPELIEGSGDPATVIERVAGERQADMIVIGSRDLGTVGRWLQGSVSAHVATHAPTTVTVVR